jgi:hypothetical protein
MTLRDDLLPIADSIRGIPGELGLRGHTVTARVRTWSGGRPGVGTKIDTDTVLTVGAGAYNPKVTRVNEKDITASGGLYRQLDVKVGPFTPEYTGGGVTTAILDPASTLVAAEILFKIEGPGYPSGGAWFEKVGTEMSTSANSTKRFIVLRQTGKQL